MADVVGVNGQRENFRVVGKPNKPGILFDLSNCSEDWIMQKDDTVYVTIPEIRLLDQNFIDEARTKSFFESGKWSNADRQAMYDRARERMIRRCMNPENKKVARENAIEQMQKMLAPIASPKAVKVR